MVEWGARFTDQGEMERRELVRQDEIRRRIVQGRHREDLKGLTPTQAKAISVYGAPQSSKPTPPPRRLKVKFRRGSKGR